MILLESSYHVAFVIRMKWVEKHAYSSSNNTENEPDYGPVYKLVFQDSKMSENLGRQKTQKGFGLTWLVDCAEEPDHLGHGLARYLQCYSTKAKIEYKDSYHIVGTKQRRFRQRTGFLFYMGMFLFEVFLYSYRQRA
jgi:hypothetical protein